MLDLYASLMSAGGPVLRHALLRRSGRGKEDAGRLGERMGVYEKNRPSGALLWLHAASVGEAQSALILITALLQERTPFKNILVTTGTVTSARLMEARLPPGAFHQFYPLDQPQWGRQFLDHWRPDMVLWMESELWPNMLREIGRRNIPAALVNARLSEKSFRRWKLAGGSIKFLLDIFDVILTQTENDALSFRKLGAKNVSVSASGNLKYSAAPLPCDEAALAALKKSTDGRPLWLYASTHDGEEALACRLHLNMKQDIPGLLTVLVPRHPGRRDSIGTVCAKYSLNVRLRSAGGLPQAVDDIYIADTMGELGLFYRLAPVACIGRSFSNDGGGGHNPIEAAQLGCAVLHGPNVQNLAAIYDEMDRAGAALRLEDENDFQKRVETLLKTPVDLSALQKKAGSFVREKGRVLDIVLKSLSPVIEQASRTDSKAACG